MLAYPWIAPVIIFSILVFIGANLHPLWSDEAETALFARNIHQNCCLPTGWDGVNLIGYGNAVSLNSDLVANTPPLQYYLTALSFRIFGESSFTARLPFILFSIASVIVLYYVTLDLTKKRLVATLATFLLSLSIPFVLFAYQARYYPLTVFFGLLFFYCALKLNQKGIFRVGFVLAGLLYAFSHYISFAIFFTSVFVSLTSDLLFPIRKKELREFVFSYISLGIVISLVMLFWFSYFRPLENRTQLTFTGIFDLISTMPSAFIEAARYFNHNNSFPILFLPLVFFLIYKGHPDYRRPILLILTTTGVYLVLLAQLSITFYSDSPFTAIRHNMVLFPLFIIVSAIILDWLFHRKRLLFWPILALFLTTNIFTIQGWPPRSFLWEYTGEIINPYPTPDKVVADYLIKNANDGDTAFVNLDRDHEPLHFHLRNKIRFVNRILPNNQKLFPKNHSRLPEYVYKFRGKPDWIILYSKRGFDGSYFTFDSRPMPPVDLASEYEEIVLPIFFSDLSRSEIELHAFKEITPEERDQIFIYRRKD